MLRLLLYLHAVATLFMVGVIWYVQIVHYPLFAAVGADRFADYEAAHGRLTGLVVMPAMLLELGTALGLLALLRGRGLPLAYALAGIALLAVIWLSTFALQVPQHGRLLGGFDVQAHARLVATNWIRTIAWSIRGLLAIGMIDRAAASVAGQGT